MCFLSFIIKSNFLRKICRYNDSIRQINSFGYIIYLISVDLSTKVWKTADSCVQRVPRTESTRQTTSVRWRSSDHLCFLLQRFQLWLCNEIKESVFSRSIQRVDTIPLFTGTWRRREYLSTIAFNYGAQWLVWILWIDMRIEICVFCFSCKSRHLKMCDKELKSLLFIIMEK